MTKYNSDCPDIILQKDIKRLSNQIWKLIPMRENQEDWKKQLDTVINEITGFDEIFLSLNFVILLSKLEGLKIQESDFWFFRITIFEVLELLNLEESRSTK